MEPPLLQASGLSFRYGRKRALDEFELDLDPGRIVLLLGLNGAGKSTALKLLGGEGRPQSGWVRVRGRDPRRARTRRHLYTMAEIASPPSHLSAREVLTLHLALWDRPAPKARLKELLEQVELGAVARQRVATFSKGMRRRLELACLIGVDADLWLLDEPQAGLDPAGLRLLRQTCEDARERGRSLVIASHALGDVPALANEVLILAGGRTVFRGDRTDLLQRMAAQGFVVHGAGTDFPDALREFAGARGLKIEGPEVPTGPLEDLLFEITKPAAKESETR